MKPYIKNRLWIVIIAIILIFIYKTDFSLHISKIFSTLYPVIIALLFAWFLIPAKIKAEKLLLKSNKKFLIRHSKVLSAFIIYFLFIGIIAFFFIYLIPILKDGIINAYNKMTEYYYIIEKYIDKDTITNLINPNLYITGAKNTVSIVFKFIMSFVVLIYILLEHRQLKITVINIITVLIGDNNTERLIYYFSKTNTIFIKYFYSKLISSIILGVLIITGFLIFRISYPVFFGIIVALSNMIPIFGAFISGIPIALTTLSEYGIAKTIIAMSVIIVGQQIENGILTPKIIGNTIGLSGFWILFTVILGGGIFGFWGILICIPVAATLKMLYSEVVLHMRNDKNDSISK